MSGNQVSPDSGVYSISCSANGGVYVGSSVSIRSRWSAHHRDLRRNRHPNPHLQNAWNKYGESTFTFAVLEAVRFRKAIKLIRREQVWMNRLKPTFNIVPTAVFTGPWPVTPEQRAHLEELGRRRTERARANLDRKANERLAKLAAGRERRRMNFVNKIRARIAARAAAHAGLAALLSV